MLGIKLSAMKRVISKFGAYSSHLIALSEDASIKPADRAKLRGYSIKWANAKYILGCTFYSDLLSPCAVFFRTIAWIIWVHLLAFFVLYKSYISSAPSLYNSGPLIHPHLRALLRRW